MCDRRQTRAPRERAHWRRLYATLSLTMAAFALVEFSPLAPALKIPLECGVAVLTFGAMARWVWANRVALDRVHWCACASRTVTVRVIVSRGPHVPPAPVHAPGERPGRHALTRSGP